MATYRLNIDLPPDVRLDLELLDELERVMRPLLAKWWRGWIDVSASDRRGEVETRSVEELREEMDPEHYPLTGTRFKASAHRKNEGWEDWNDLYELHITWSEGAGISAEISGLDRDEMETVQARLERAVREHVERERLRESQEQEESMDEARRVAERVEVPAPQEEPWWRRWSRGLVIAIVGGLIVAGILAWIGLT